MKNKELAKSFLQLVSTGQVNEAFDQMVSPNFKHHNQYFSGSREALLEAMKDAHLTSPNNSIEVKQCFSDKDTVITHSLVIKQNMKIAVMHIFRMEENKIVELWDLGQVINKDSPNENGLF